MKKQKRYLLIFTALCSLVLSGCGTQLYEMTKEEEDLIVQSAAYYVAKHNIQQKDGVSAVVDPDSVTLETENTEHVEENTESDTEVGETDVDPSGEEGQTVEDETESLAQLIGHGNDLKITYAGSYAEKHYVEGAAYSIDADTGKTFYVMQFTIENMTDEEVAVDNVSLNPIFKMISDGVSAKSEVTFLTTDLSTYQGTIPARDSVETILLFEVSESIVEQITEPTLQITIDNVTKNVKL